MLIVEPAEKICRGKIAFLRVAFAAAGDEVAIGIVLQLGKRDDMVDAARTNGKPTAAVKTETAFPQMDSAAQGWMFEEVQLFEVVGAIGAQGARVVWTGGDGGYFLGKRTSTRWPALPRSIRRRRPRAIKRRTAQRAELPQRPTPRASQGMENRSRSFLSKRL